MSWSSCSRAPRPGALFTAAPSPARGAPSRPGRRPAATTCRPATRRARRRDGRATPVAPGRLHRLRLRPVRGARRQAAMDTWLKHSPFRAAGIYISGDSRACRTPAQPDARPGSAPSSPRAGGCCRSRSARRPRASRASRGTSDDDKINPEPGADGTTPSARAQGRAEADKTVADAARARHRAGQHALLRPRGLRPRQHRLPRVGAAFAQRLDRRGSHALGYVSGFYSSAGSGIKMLDDARVGRPGQFDAARPDLDRALGRRGQHLDHRTSARTAGARRPDEAVPGRPQRDLGRRHDQHRPQLPRPRQAARRRRREPLRRRQDVAPDYPG